MTLRSMTGFGRSDGVCADRRWTWELRSVNGKGLDVRLRLHPVVDLLQVPGEELGHLVVAGRVRRLAAADQHLTL